MGSGVPDSGMAGSTGGETASAGGAMHGAGGSGGAPIPPSGTVRLVAIGDTGEGNQSQHDVAAQMDAKCAASGGCDAVLLLGDNFYDNGVSGVDDAQWLPKFEDVYDLPNLVGLKFHAALGNHDYGLTSSGSADAQIAYSSLPVGTGPGSRLSGMFSMPARYYDVRIGHVHLFATDTQDGSVQQTEELGASVAASDATWKIVFGHHPRFTSGDHNKDNWLVDLVAGYYAMLGAVYCNTDMLLTGHDHNMEFIDKGRDPSCPNTHFVISGAGSKVRSSGGVVRPEDGPGGLSLFYDETIEGFAYMEFMSGTLHFEFIDHTGQVLFTRNVVK